MFIVASIPYREKLGKTWKKYRNLKCNFKALEKSWIHSFCLKLGEVMITASNDYLLFNLLFRKLLFIIILDKVHIIAIFQ